jgi:hypothetical protein
VLQRVEAFTFAAQRQFAFLAWTSTRTLPYQVRHLDGDVEAHRLDHLFDERFHLTDRIALSVRARRSARLGQLLVAEQPVREMLLADGPRLLHSQ